MDLLAKLESTLNDEIFYEISTRQFKLEEKGRYIITVTQCDKNKLIAIRPDIMKKQASYLKKKPKDCDYILVDMQRKYIFFIELKESTVTSKANAVRKQILSGKKWLDHILSICDIIDEFSEFKIYPIYICALARQDRKQTPRPNSADKIYKMNGSRLDLREFYRIGNSITYKNFR